MEKGENASHQNLLFPLCFGKFCFPQGCQYVVNG